MEKIVSLCKRRGFVYPGSEIYGGLANTYDYGPVGVELKRNLQNYWWDFFVNRRDNILGLDTAILMSPKVWEASGHTESFTNVLVDCTSCQYRTRADHLIEDALPKIGNVEGKLLPELDKIISDHNILCPKCGKTTWTKSRNFNQLFETQIGIITSGKNTVYLRGELAQGMFVNFKLVLDNFHPKLPFGLAQSGKAFRNEITMGKFTFRTLEFDLAEFEYFVDPDNWEKEFESWKTEMYKFALSLGLGVDKLRWRTHKPEELSHYSKRTEDLEYQFPWGFKEMWGLAYRTDFDLKNHMAKSGVDLQYTDAISGRKFIPHVVEPTFGLSRLLTIILLNSYWEDTEKNRVVMRFPYRLAPYKVAVFPLVANKENLVSKARTLYLSLKSQFSCAWDDRGNIGKRYYAQDEIGTPWCVTVDYQTLEDDTVTVRDRDTAQQVRMPVSELDSYFQDQLK
ncbi:MAG: Glycine-tRNA ligase [Candidatus Amesbacteria bacterium GW2011_GWA2_47_11b]|uniref:glycine--tRNA ligase n=3 Tax=Candidatus Amesiibacteriota TaxID=1752730 RepID=A0A0G1SH68_9BACT|nr:MAG: glycyl-tRNA synthetase, glycyl-tRNA synthetase [Microgenomates group bacterium GW2011_GWC1_46_20]KKU58613.1 MAG: Glycine-tRNA ligase [Candidatus Amesbacteria bacterium GW2011_GWA2_47_11b]KKU68761.1 MAG: Glycine-tRNA ligase [Candidatus Amesbacteria bacterium GW2011_GWA1_47_20]KKU83756.1 MAG: Glycine-tRNA ligase [Candidatus Amesbacteria bacterium GW2011_GWC2_47_8]